MTVGRLKLSARGPGILSFLAVLNLLCSAQARSADWLPVTPEELQMTQEPKAPGAPAIYLYREEVHDDFSSFVNVYVRLKILTAEGRKYGDIEIPYFKGVDNLRSIDARVIRSDGSVVSFDGNVYEKAIVAAHGGRLLAKTFTLPEVQPGCIVEYRFRFYTPMGLLFNSHWLLSQDLFTRYAKYALTPYPHAPIRWSLPLGVPAGSNMPVMDHGVIRMETHDVPAFVSEELMPPENEIKYRVDFIYPGPGRIDTDAARFWKSFGQSSFHEMASFVGYPKDMERVVAQIVQPTDSAETRLRKIYAYVAQMRNTAYERQKTEEETERERQSPAHSVKDVMKRGSGDTSELNNVFVSLARGAGLRADLALVGTRDEYFFHRQLMNPRQLNSNLVIVTLDGKNLFLDPGVPFTPFGMLPWNVTAVESLRLDDDGGAWVSTPLPPVSASRTERKAQLKLDRTGSLAGKLAIHYIGLEAAWRRIAERNEDETSRKQFLEDEVKWSVPAGVEVKLTNSPDWKGSDEPLVAEFDLEVPGWATAAGRKQFLKAGLFGNRDDRTFEHSTRVQPIYFEFPYQRSDDIVVELPAGVKIASLPKNHKVAASTDVYSYETSAEAHDNVVHLNRNLSINMLLVEAKYYPELRNFYQSVRTADEEQIVVTPAP